MKPTTALLSTLSLLATAVTAYDYIDFPTSITCPGVAPIKQDKLERAARRAKEADTPYEEHASNLASGKCVDKPLPYYIYDVGEGGVAVGVAYDKSNRILYYCLHTDPTFSCTEQFVDPQKMKGRALV
ncbi:hypothetical protein SLS56_002139 [Neofusicoccum ribis]|uniref:Uncharacterized protein n=1 Tax=Neofusicoccum ribis TaxID=45134 RepID=A0ABR3T5L0_9PEZI